MAQAINISNPDYHDHGNHTSVTLSSTPEGNPQVTGDTGGASGSGIDALASAPAPAGASPQPPLIGLGIAISGAFSPAAGSLAVGAPWMVTAGLAAVGLVAIVTTQVVPQESRHRFVLLYRLIDWWCSRPRRRHRCSRSSSR